MTTLNNGIEQKGNFLKSVLVSLRELGISKSYSYF